MALVPAQHLSNVTVVCFSPRESLVALASAHRIALWDFREGILRASLEGPPAISREMTFSRDGRLLACGDLDGNVVVLEVGTRKVVTRFFVPGGEVGPITFSPDGTMLATAAFFSHELRVIDAGTGQPIATLVTKPGGIFHASFSNDGKYLVSADTDQQIRFYRRDDWKFEKSYYGHLDEVWCVAFSPSAPLFVSGCKDGTIFLWKSRPEPGSTPVLSLPESTSSTIGSQDGRLISKRNEQDCIEIFDVAGARQFACVEARGATNWAFSTTWLAALDAKSNLQVWNVRENKILRISY